MAFPNNPSNGDTFVRYGRTYQYDSAMLMWKVPKSGVLLGELADIDITTNPPTAGDALVWSGSTFEPEAVNAVTVYQTNLPLSGNSAGDMAYVTDLSSLYIFTGSGAGGGWFNIAIINESPTITTGPDATYILSLDGTPTVITLAATDPEEVPTIWSYAVTSGSLGNTATITQADNVFTITPSTDSADFANFSITFTASDGVNTSTATSNFILSSALLLDFSVGTGNVFTYTATNGLIVNNGTSGTYNSSNYNLKFMFNGTHVVNAASEYWMAVNGDFGYLEFNLSNVPNVFLSTIRFYPRTRTDSFTSITSVESSPDGSTWYVVPNSSTGTVDANWLEDTYLEVDISSTGHKYFRANLTYTGSWGISMNEVEFYGYSI